LRQLVVVATGQSGRRLREAIAVCATGIGKAAFAPRVLTPDGLLVVDRKEAVASRPEMLMAWSEVFRRMDPGQFPEVFPFDPADRSFSWALHLAETFLGLQATLGEIGWRIADVPMASATLEGGLPEEPRWRQLAELERRYDAALKKRGRIDVQAARASAAQNPEAPAGIDRVVVVATPDPLPAALSVLAACAKSIPVEILVYAPEGEADSFDGWGRPISSAWARRPFALAGSRRTGPAGSSEISVCRAELCADPSAQAERVAALAAGYGTPDGLLGIGVADPDLLPALESVFGHARIATFNPEGRARRGEALFHLLSALAAVSQEPRFSSVEALARCPDFIAFLQGRLGAGFSTKAWLSGLDELRDRNLPQDLAAAGSHAREGSVVALGLAEVGEMSRQLAEGTFADGAAAALGRIFAARRLDPERESDARLADAARAWAEVVSECAPLAPALRPAEGWELALRLFGSTVRTDEKPAGAVELQGWLELLWEDAPHLAVVGLNDGRVPEAIVGDPFLPETLRERIGLRSNESRFARDAYILRAAAASRERGGRLDVFLGRSSETGDLLKPSRLLLQCRDEELPERIGLLFREPEISGRNVAWSRAWRLAPPPPARPPERVWVTGIRQWLACPFRFYLGHVLKMEPVDPEKDEMGDADFGTLCHAALEGMARDEGMRECTDAAALREFLAAALEREARARFGSRLALPLVVQLESARQRLGKAAEIEVRERACGWRTLEVERKFEIAIAGMTVAGKIDRIDRNLETGRIRVLDYKTTDSARSPEDAHLKRAGRGTEGAREFAKLVQGKMTLVWKDLQLPLYVEALAAEFPSAACGYFNLPKAVGETGIQLWESYSPELRASALRCAEGACTAIRTGDFWPPSESIGPEWDPFAALFHRGAAESIEWEGAR
jgi:ATP-dependent helicase/nuclease subunit B